MRSLVLVVVVVAIWALLAGCATVLHGKKQGIGLSSNPPGAIVLIDGHTKVITPVTIDLDRDRNHTFLFQKEGYEDASFTVTSSTSGWVLGNVLVGGIIGGVVDFSTGAAKKLSQDSIHVNLIPLQKQASSSPLSTAQGTEVSSPAGPLPP